MLGVGIVGCGLIGQRRARALDGARLVAVADTDFDRARAMAEQYHDCQASADWRAVTAHKDIDVVLVATINNALAPVTLAAVHGGKHVLVEKPAGRNTDEVEPILAVARQTGSIVKVGFNKRFHPAFLKARQLVDAGAIGTLMYIRARYGHGGRLGYDREWRSDPTLAGGGELLDSGVHLIDLARWFLGDFVEVHGHMGTFFWNMTVEDNGFLMLKTQAGKVAWLHASCTEWKNVFSFEIFGRDGKLAIDGLGGSYGTQRLSFYRMLPRMGPPETTIWEYPGEDRSWQEELDHFLACVAAKQSPCGNLEDALATLQVVGRVYAQAAAAREEVRQVA